jgi:hypothetical protein
MGVTDSAQHPAGSRGSLLSYGSLGSILSIGSAGSILSGLSSWSVLAWRSQSAPPALPGKAR